MPMTNFPLWSWRRRRRLLPLLLLASITFIVYHFREPARERFKSLQKGHDNIRHPPGSSLWPGSVMGGRWDEPDMLETGNATNTASHGYNFKPGTLKPIGKPYIKTVILPRTHSEDVSWLTDIFPPGGDVNTAIYTVDDPKATLRPPKNKGHEVMVYLSYIIDHYDTLADVSIFLHAHRQAWHNNELLSNDAVQLISRLSSEKVTREGYMNLRCHWEPGCPDWMHPGYTSENPNKKEQTSLARVWKELFPADAVPKTLAQPCCAQFAVSRERIQSLGKDLYIFYRDWLLRTELSDAISGRVWEWLWGYVFTGRTVICPKEHICYCDGFGVCFGGEEQYDKWWEKMWEKRTLAGRLTHWNEAKEKQDRWIKLSKEILEIPEPGLDKELERQIAELNDWLEAELEAAKERGNHPENRAKEAG